MDEKININKLIFIAIIGIILIGIVLLIFFEKNKGHLNSQENINSSAINIKNYNLSSIEIKNINTAKSLNSNYSIKKYKTKINSTCGFALVNDEIIYGKNNTKIVKTIDGGENWEIIWDYSDEITCTGTRVLWRSSKGILIKGCDNSGNISISSLNDELEWIPNKPIFACKNKSGEGFGTAWFITENLETGSIFIGEYGARGVGSNVNCSYIHKSVDNGVTWSISYNSSQNQDFVGQHIHGIKYNKYNGYLYAIQDCGGGKFQKCGILRSKDDGKSWEVIKIDSGKDVMLALEFTPEYRIFGGDTNGAIWRTSDDLNYEEIYKLPDDYKSSIWQMVRDYKTGYILASARSNSNNKTILLFSPDDGNNWYGLSGFEIEAEGPFAGWYTFSDISDKGRIFTHFNMQESLRHSYVLNLSDLKLEEYS